MDVNIYSRSDVVSCPNGRTNVYEAERMDNNVSESIYVINPTLKDLISGNIYKFKLKENIYYIPLWQYENYFDISISESELIVLCIPKFNNEKIHIDDENNLYIDLNIEINDIILKMKNNDLMYSFVINDCHFSFELNKLYFRDYQTITLKENGIPKPVDIDLNNIIKSDIFLNITIHF